ncbi:hypothetical protein HYC85_003480 [Camellia sinensis]|uniref:Transmembrane protein n=1 Tax=Camellia sinensis TaxID=4442 RepID=A0A7J7HUT2_CAMSI|nr:hypothetical protein HYC85_003480 [Camellia sinensis]
MGMPAYLQPDLEADLVLPSIPASSVNYQDRIAFLFLFFPSLLLVLRSWLWGGLPVQLYQALLYGKNFSYYFQAWLLILYTCLALRENILRVNGSDIRPWWIKQHYFAMAMALISLTWEIEREPDCSQKQRGVQLFLQWAIMQGVAMLLQNRYQRQRLCTHIALARFLSAVYFACVCTLCETLSSCMARRMDVVWGETVGVDGQLWLLALSLLAEVEVILSFSSSLPSNNPSFIHGFEAYVGILLLKVALAGVVSEWQVVTCGVLLIVMAVGNFANTVQTLVAKSRFKAKMKKTKSKVELN